MPGRLYLPAEGRMLRGLGRGRRARVSRQEHGARRGAARGAWGIAERRTASHGGQSPWPVAPLPPPPLGPGSRSLLPDSAQPGIPSKGEGAETWGGARSPGKEPRSLPGPPRSRKPGDGGESVAFAPGEVAEGGLRCAACPQGVPGSAPCLRNLSALHARSQPGDRPALLWPGLRWPGASLTRPAERRAGARDAL